jgi:hypothetical protein
MNVLREVHRSDAFARVRDFDAAARFHVWHSRLGLAAEVDRQVQDGLRAGRGFVVVGDSGSGKTSTLAAAALATEGFEQAHLPLRLSVSGVADNSYDPRFLASRVVRAIAQVSDQAQQLVDRAAPEGTAAGPAGMWKVRVGGKATQLSKEIRQRTENVNFERTPNEVLDAASEALRLLEASGLRPVLVLEDADGLLRLPGKNDEERHELASAFFADGLDPLLRHLGVPAAVAVQPDYLTLDGFQQARALFDGVAFVPVPSQLSSAGLQLLISETLRTSTADYAVDDVFDPEALEVLVHNRYSLPTIRAVIEVCSAGVLKALEEDHDQVLEDDVGYAISQG